MQSSALRSPTVPSEAQTLRLRSEKHDQIISEGRRQLEEAGALTERASEASLEAAKMHFSGSMQALKEAQVAVEGQLAALGPTVTHSLLSTIFNARQNCERFREAYTSAIGVTTNTNSKRDALAAAQQDALDLYAKRCTLLETELRSFVLSTRHLSDVLFHVRKYAMVVMQERVVWQQRHGMNPAGQLPEEESSALSTTDTFLAKCERLLEDLRRAEMPRIQGGQAESPLGQTNSSPVLEAASSSTKSTRTVTPVGALQRSSQALGRESSLGTIPDDEGTDALLQNTSRERGASTPAMLGKTATINSSGQFAKLQQFLPGQGAGPSPSFIFSGDSSFAGTLRPQASISPEAQEAMQNTIGSRRTESMRLIPAASSASGGGGEALGLRSPSFSLNQNAFNSVTSGTAQRAGATNSASVRYGASGDAFAATTNRLIGEIRAAKRNQSPANKALSPSSGSFSPVRSIGITFVPPSVQPSYANPPNLSADTVDSVVGNFIKRSEILRSRDKEATKALSYGTSPTAFEGNADTVSVGEREWRVRGGDPLRWVKPKEELALLKVMLASSSGSDVSSLLEALRSAHESHAALVSNIKSTMASKCRGLREGLMAMRRDLSNFRSVVVPTVSHQLKSEAAQQLEHTIPLLVGESSAVSAAVAQRTQREAVAVAVATALGEERELRQRQEQARRASAPKGLAAMPLRSSVSEQPSSLSGSGQHKSLGLNHNEPLSASTDAGGQTTPTSPLSAARDQFLDQQKQRQDEQKQAMLLQQQQLLTEQQRAVAVEQELLRQQRKQLADKLKFVMPMKKKKSVKPLGDSSEPSTSVHGQEFEGRGSAEGTDAGQDFEDEDLEAIEGSDRSGQEDKLEEPDKDVDAQTKMEWSFDHANSVSKEASLEAIAKGLLSLFDEHVYRDELPADEGSNNHNVKGRRPSAVEITIDGRRFILSQCDDEQATNAAYPQQESRRESQAVKTVKRVSVVADIEGATSSPPRRVQDPLAARQSSPGRPWAAPFYNVPNPMMPNKATIKEAQTLAIEGLGHDPEGRLLSTRQEPDVTPEVQRAGMRSGSTTGSMSPSRLAFPSTYRSASVIAMAPTSIPEPVIPMAEQWKRQADIDRRIGEALRRTDALQKSYYGRNPDFVDLKVDDRFEVRTLEVLNTNGESATAIHQPVGSSILEVRERIKQHYSPIRSPSLQRHPTLTSPTEPRHYTEAIDLIPPRPPTGNGGTNRHPLIAETRAEGLKARLRHTEKPRY